MTIKRSLLLALFGTSLLLNAQDEKVRWKTYTGTEKNQDGGFWYHKFVKGDAGSIVGLRVLTKSPVIGGMNQVSIDRTLVAFQLDGMKEVKADKTKLLWGEGPVSVETIEHFNKQFRVIASKADPETGKLLVIQQVLGPRSLTGKGAELLAEIPFDRLGKTNAYFKPNITVGFTTLVSVDSTKMLLQLTPESTVHSAGCPIYAHLFDKEMKSLWWNKLSPDPGAKSSRIMSTKVDPTGAVWYLIKNVSDPDPKTKGEAGYNWSIYRLDSAGQTTALLDLPGSEFVQDARMDMRLNGTITVAGVYSDAEMDRNVSVGVFQCTVNGAGKEPKFDGFKLYPFAKRIEGKEEKPQVNMIMDRLLLKKDGGTFVIARKSGEETHYVSDLSGKKTPKTEQVDGAIHIFELAADGSQKWYKQLEREMGSANNALGQILPMVYENNLLLLLNDAEGNIEKRKQKLPIAPVDDFKDAILVEYKSDGTDKSKVVLTEPRRLGIVAGSAWQPTAGLVVLLGAEKPKGSVQPVAITLSGEAKK
ncbi:MAG TPA: hypothetical protein PKG57_01930 [Flavobacteriales bacterium]|nr:hypothetical protein [Flavobacteriales bacterium]